MNRFRSLAWGLTLASIPAVGAFRVLPNGLGYFLLALGATGLVVYSPRFKKAAVFAWIALIWLSVSSWSVDLLQIGDPIEGDGGILYSCIRVIIDCLLISSVLGGIRDMPPGIIAGNFRRGLRVSKPLMWGWRSERRYCCVFFREPLTGFSSCA